MKKILLLEGGFNEEHEISLNTSKEVQKSLERMKFKFEVLQVNPVNFSEKIEFYDDNVLCFNALHGTYGEDGTIQKILENNKISYTHSDSKVSKIAFDKNLTKIKIKNSEVVFLESIVFDKSQIKIDKFYMAYNRFNSFVLKPVSSGSSFGVKIFYSINDIENFFLNYTNEIKIYSNVKKLMIFNRLFHITCCDSKLIFILHSGLNYFRRGLRLGPSWLGFNPGWYQRIYTFIIQQKHDFQS